MRKRRVKPVRLRLTKVFAEFLGSEQASGVILILCTIVSIALANSPVGNDFMEFWHTKIGFEIGTLMLNFTVQHWINDGLMVVFFLLIGLEIERELYIGELSDFRNASLPMFAALGGMVTPALLHFLLNQGTRTQSGFGIPMATDIAFALGVLALLGNKVPLSLKVFLAALAIVDDLGAIVVIALFYASDFSSMYLVLALAILAGLLMLNRLGFRCLAFYLIPGLMMWYFMLKSGIHATLAGVLLAFAIPFAGGKEKSPSYRLQHFLHKPVAFIIMPLFALANTGIALSPGWLQALATRNSLGIFAGLFIGKPVGIVLFSVLAVKLGLSQWPSDVSWKHSVGAGFLGGIGFTMSIFITFLAFGSPDVIQSSKVAILLSSLIAGATGFMILNKGEANNS